MRKVASVENVTTNLAPHRTYSNGHEIDCKSTGFHILTVSSFSPHLQAIGRGRIARVEALKRRCVRLEEDARRACVWAGTTNNNEGESSSRCTLGDTATPSEDLASKIAGDTEKRESEHNAALKIQTVSRGRSARGKVAHLRQDRHKRCADARARARHKVRQRMQPKTARTV